MTTGVVVTEYEDTRMVQYPDAPRDRFPDGAYRVERETVAYGVQCSNWLYRESVTRILADPTVLRSWCADLNPARVWNRMEVD